MISPHVVNTHKQQPGRAQPAYPHNSIPLSPSIPSLTQNHPSSPDNCCMLHLTNLVPLSSYTAIADGSIFDVPPSCQRTSNTAQVHPGVDNSPSRLTPPGPPTSLNFYLSCLTPTLVEMTFGPLEEHTLLGRPLPAAPDLSKDVLWRRGGLCAHESAHVENFGKIPRVPHVLK